MVAYSVIQLLQRLRQENGLNQTQEVEVAVSRDLTVALQPGRQSKIPSQKQTNENAPGLGVVACASNPSTLGGRGEKIT